MEQHTEEVPHNGTPNGDRHRTGLSHLEARDGLAIYNIRRHEGKKEQECMGDAFFSKRMLTDDIHFHRRIGSRSQMSRSGKRRAVLETSWTSLRGRWSVPLSLWILDGVMRCGEEDGMCEGWSVETGGGRKLEDVTSRVKTRERKKTSGTFHFATVSLDPRHFRLSNATSTMACTWDAGSVNWGLDFIRALSINTPRSSVPPPLPLSNYKRSHDHLRIAVNEIPRAFCLTLNLRNVLGPSRPRTTHAKQHTTRYAPLPGNPLPQVVSVGALAFTSYGIQSMIFAFALVSRSLILCQLCSSWSCVPPL